MSKKRKRTPQETEAQRLAKEFRAGRPELHAYHGKVLKLVLRPVPPMTEAEQRAFEQRDPERARGIRETVQRLAQENGIPLAKDKKQ